MGKMYLTWKTRFFFSKNSLIFSGEIIGLFLRVYVSLDHSALLTPAVHLLGTIVSLM